MTLFGYWLPTGSFSVAIKVMQRKGKVNLQKANVAGAISLVTHQSVQLNV
jgi:hypothetical protein